MDQGALLQNVDAETSPYFSVVMKNLKGRMSSSGLSKEKEDSVIQKLKTLKKHHQIFLKNQFLYDTMKACCADNLKKPLLYKAGTIIIMEDLSSCKKIQKPSPLTPEEVQEMKHIANEGIAERCSDLKNLIYESGKQCDHDDLLPLSEAEKIVIKAKQILSEDIKACNKTTHLYLEKILAFSHTCDKIREVVTINLDWLEKRCSLLHLKLRILELRISQAFYCEEPHQIEALKLLEDILKEKLSELKTELQKLQALTTQYNMLKGTEYDAVHHQYIDVLRKLKEQAWTLNQMSNS